MCLGSDAMVHPMSLRFVRFASLSFKAPASQSLYDSMAKRHCSSDLSPLDLSTLAFVSPGVAISDVMSELVCGNRKRTYRLTDLFVATEGLVVRFTAKTQHEFREY